MKASQSIAVWLFERLGFDGALSGDLLEECTRGRSVIWYWRQVLVAIWVGIWGTIRDHKLIAFRAVVTGFAMELLFLLLWNQFSHLLPDWPMFSRVGTIVNFSLMLLTQAATGWVVARTHRGHSMVFVFLFLICDLFWWAQRSFAFASIVVLSSIHQCFGGGPAVRSPGFLPYLAWYVMYTLTLGAGVLVGGIFGARPQRLPSAPPLT